MPSLSLRGKKGFLFFGNDGIEQAVPRPAGLIFLHRGWHSRRVLQDGVGTSAPDMPATSIDVAGARLEKAGKKSGFSATIARPLPAPKAAIMFRG